MNKQIQNTGKNKGQNRGQNPTKAVKRDNGTTIAYHTTFAQITPNNPPEKATGPEAGPEIGVVFLGGFGSDMDGTKALALEKWCNENNRQFLRFDYGGHGQSSGEFADGTISAWADDAIFAIENLSNGPIVLVGSSMGGWMMLLATLKIGARIKGLLGLAAAPDFTEDIMNRDLSSEQKEKVEKDGRVEIPNCYDPNQPYIITKALIDDGRKNLLLNGPINISVPVRLIQGMKDEDVHWQTALRLQEKLLSDDVEIQFIKNATHRLSDEQDITRLTTTLEALLKHIEN